MSTRQRPNSATVLLIGALGAFSILSGCGRPSAPAVSLLAPGRQGHVFVAQLISEHPLYDQYRRLDLEIAALRRGCQVPQVSPVFLELGEIFLPGPELPEFPVERFAARKAQWRLALLPDLPAPTTSLPADLAAELRWQQRRAERLASQQLARVISREEECVARERAAAVRARQEALNNVGLDLTQNIREAREAAETERQRLWAEIEAETAQARAQADARITAESQRIEETLRRQMAAVEAEIAARRESRAQIFVKSGSELRSRMSNTLTPPDPLPPGEGATWRPAGGLPASRFQPTLAPMIEADRRVRLAQAARLAAIRADLGADIYRSTALAALRIAGVKGWRVHLPPEERQVGRDLTEQIRPELRGMFHPYAP